MNISSLFNLLLVAPIVNALVALYKVFVILKLPGALGFAVIALTILIRFILYPLSKSQLKIMKKNAEKMALLKPQLAALKQKYKDDKTKFNQEQLRLYKEAGINPTAGCLQNLLQFPIMIALYNVFVLILSSNAVESINKVIYTPLLKIESLDVSFFGLNLIHRPNEWQKFGWWLLLMPIATGLLQYWQVKLMTPNNSTPAPKQPLALAKTQPEGQDQPKKEEDMNEMMQKQMTFMMPLMIGFFAYSFPLGLSFYWNTYTIFGIIQQYQINKQGVGENEKNRK